MSGYKTVSVLYKDAAQTAAGVATTVVSDEFPMTAEDSQFFVARITTASTTVVGSLTAKLQENWSDAAGWHDVGSEAEIAITGNGTVEIKLNNLLAADAAQLPTAPRGRIVVTGTNAGDTTSVTEVIISRRL